MVRPQDLEDLTDLIDIILLIKGYFLTTFIIDTFIFKYK